MASSHPQSSENFLLIDGFKALGAVLIVLHHLAFYGPVTDYAAELLPSLMTWLAQDGRLAVQLFLVVSGFLAARGLRADFQSEHPMDGRGALQRVMQRYWRLAAPFGMALLVGMAAAALARPLLDHELVPDAPQLTQFIAHLALLHGVFGVESLQAGVWYVAIDFQLAVLLTLVVYGSGRLAQGGPSARQQLFLAATAVLVCGSLFLFNRNSAWDNWGLYFFGAYGMGVLAWHFSEPGRSRLGLFCLMTVAVLALWVEFRTRIMVASMAALVLGWARQNRWFQGVKTPQVIRTLAQDSYAIFLIHYPICILISTLWLQLEAIIPADMTHWLPYWYLAGVVMAVLASVLAGHLFFQFVEKPLQRLSLRRARSRLATQA